MSGFVAGVRTFIAEKNLIPHACPIVVGVSGGADSLALLLLLHSLGDSLDLIIRIAHLNHGLRGSDSDGDEAFVRAWGEKLNLPCFVRHVDIRQLAGQAGIGTEEAGRAARQAFFAELADDLDRSLTGSGRPTSRIALAHHLNDQAETLLMNMGRGSGLDGLAGIRPRNGRLIRPLLEQSRASIEDWLTGQSISWRQDESNLELFALRNRLRHLVLPAWCHALGYDPAPLLARTASSLDEDRSFFESLTLDAARECLDEKDLVIPAWLVQPAALQNRLLRLFWQRGSGSGQDLAYVHIRLLRDWLPNAHDGQRLCLPGHRQALVVADRLCLVSSFDSVKDELPEPVLSESVRLNLPGVTEILLFNRQITADLIENGGNIVYNDTTECFHLDRIRGCVVRHRQPGDRIHPAGRTGGKTLKKFLNEQRVPFGERDRLLIVACGDDIVWLPGLAAGADFVARPGDGSTGPLVALKFSSLDQADS